MKEPREELAALSAALRYHIEREARRGRTHVSFPGLREAAESLPAASTMLPAAPSSATAAKPAAGTVPDRPARRAPAPAPGRGKKLPLIAPEPEAADYADRMERLDALGREASGCTLCGLCETRTRVVFARGRARNRVMFIGEAPGADEDAQGYPFVGRAGKLLDQIIDAVGFQRDEIYVANILKCRPPNNRDPEPAEIASCTPYLERQIELVDPKIICALGRFAAQFLTGNPKTPMGRLRGKIHYYKDRIMVLPTYHPAALLRNPHWKKVVWEDVQLLRKEYLR